MHLADQSNSSIAPGAHPGANVDWTLHDRYRAAVEHLEALAAEMVRRLDELNGDPDLEDGADDEPSLGSANPDRRTNQAWWADSGNADGLDREEQCEDEAGQCDDEGHDSDHEPDEGQMVPDYGIDQRRGVNPETGTSWTV